MAVNFGEKWKLCVMQYVSFTAMPGANYFPTLRMTRLPVVIFSDLIISKGNFMACLNTHKCRTSIFLLQSHLLYFLMVV